jgi:hypothetical protein
MVKLLSLVGFFFCLLYVLYSGWLDFNVLVDVGGLCFCITTNQGVYEINCTINLLLFRFVAMISMLVPIFHRIESLAWQSKLTVEVSLCA